MYLMMRISGIQAILMLLEGDPWALFCFFVVIIVFPVLGLLLELYYKVKDRIGEGKNSKKQ